MNKTKILFLSADPSNATRLRLGQELRDIREKLNLSIARDKFELHSRESLRPEDITQAIFDVEPQVLHFSGHGTTSGELCFEDSIGNKNLVETDILVDLFELVSDTITCVILNACYSENQAKAIVNCIPFVIGMNDSIGDKASIAFSVGFYRALAAGKTVEKAYKFGCVEMRLLNIQEYMKPVLIQKKKNEEKVDKPSASIQWMLVLSGRIDDCDKSKAEIIVSHLQRIMDDPSITLKKLSSGSIKIFLESRQDTFEILQYLFKEGLITEIFDYRIQDITYSAFDNEHLEEILRESGCEENEEKSKFSILQGSLSVVAPEGYLNASNAIQLQSLLLQLMESESCLGIIVDMSGVESMDSAGLISLVSALQISRKRGKKFYLASVPLSIHVIFELTQLDRAFEFIDSSNLNELNKLYYRKVA